MKKVILIGCMVLGMSVLTACGGDDTTVEVTPNSTHYDYPEASAKAMPYTEDSYDIDGINE